MVIFISTFPNASYQVHILKGTTRFVSGLLYKSAYGDFDVVIHPKRKPNKWTANIEHATPAQRLLLTIKTFVKSSAYSCQINISSLLYSSRRHQNLSQIGRFQMCASFMLLAMTRSVPSFSCGSTDLDRDESKAVIKHLMAEINFVKMLLPQQRQKWQRRLFILTVIWLLGVLGIIEVKKEDFMKGFAQVSVHMESSLSHKRKADEIDNGQDVDRIFGILSELVIVMYKDEKLQAKVEKAQKPMEASQSGAK
ncbi:1057_t:CDS:2, partial [Funneliformis caledonium]